MIVEIRIQLGSMEPTEENIRQSFDKLMAAMWLNKVRKGGDFCRVIDGELNDEATLELRVGAHARQEFLKTGVLREQQRNKEI